MGKQRLPAGEDRAAEEPAVQHEVETGMRG
jgi:hypothetical protein